MSVVVFGPLGAPPGTNYWRELHPISLVIGAVTLDFPKPTVVFQAIAAPEVNGSLWTIRYEFGCYLMIALLGVLTLLRRRWVVLALALACLTLYLVQIQIWPTNFRAGGRLVGILTPIPRFVSFFLAGTCFHLFRDQIRFTIPGVILASLLVAASFVNFTCARAIQPTAGAYLLFALAAAPIRPLRAMNQLPDFSYGVYLYAWPIQAVLITYIAGIGSWGVFALALPLSVLCGLASWYLIESPAQKLRFGFPRPGGVRVAQQVADPV